jgi:hypothetical protein
MLKQFKLNQLCADCPFRKDDKAIKLEPGRIKGIIDSLVTQEVLTFHCHKTVYGNSCNFDEEGEYTPKDVSHCPGAIAVMKKLGKDTVAVQIAERLNVIPQNHYNKAMEQSIDPEDLT